MPPAPALSLAPSLLASSPHPVNPRARLHPRRGQAWETPGVPLWGAEWPGGGRAGVGGGRGQRQAPGAAERGGASGGGASVPWLRGGD